MIDGVAHFGVHRDLLALHVEPAQTAIATWIAIQRPGGLEELVEEEATDEALAQFIAANEPVSMAEFRRLCLRGRLADLGEVIDDALSKFGIGLRSLSERWPTVYSVSFLQLYNHLVAKAEFRSRDEGAVLEHGAHLAVADRLGRVRPRTAIVPRAGVSRPRSRLMEVDLPAPLAPSRATVVPGSMVSERSSTASTSP